MKKRVLYLIMCIFAITTTNAQVSITGPGGPAPGADWGVDYFLTDAGGGIWTASNITLPGGEFKFRLNADWGTNWGATAFPSGTGTLNGPNITGIAGTYDVTFNQNTGEYSFTGGAVIAVVKLVGTSTAAEGVTMTTADGENYKITSTFTAGTLQFDIDGAVVGGTGYPSGNADADTNFIPVPAGTFTVVINIASGDYNFKFPIISLTGAAAGGWGVDTDLTTTDGENYSINGVVLTDGGCKFRQDNAWSVSWGGAAWPEGVADGSDIPALAGTYNITFNIVTGAYKFDNGLSAKGFSSANFKVYPNPTQNVWNFTSASEKIESVKIVDVLGKNVMTVSPKSNNASVDATILTKGIYFAKIATAKATETIKLMKN
jgi:hypothetical protein